MSKIIPERIREARESVGMTDDQFADAIGCEPTIGWWL
ncbi:transcriptional regulator with XRE-family HTH domain [Bradyrhizobium sp. LM2.7]